MSDLGAYLEVKKHITSAYDQVKRGILQGYDPKSEVEVEPEQESKIITQP